VGRAQFLVAKYMGLIAALALLTYVNLLAALLASRMAFDAYGSTDLFAVGIFALSVIIAYSLGGFSNFFLRRPFVSDAVFSLILMMTVAFIIINFYNKEGTSQAFATGVDWRMVPASVLVLFALWILAALALACSTRFDMIPTLAICSGFFLIGLISDYIYHQLGGKMTGGGPWWATALYTIIPNWQNFWIADAVETGRNTYQWGYVGKALAYAACYIGAVLAVAVTLFEERELS